MVSDKGNDTASGCLDYLRSCKKLLLYIMYVLYVCMYVCMLSQALKKQLENVDAKINEVLRELQKIESERSHLRYIHTYTHTHIYVLSDMGIMYY